MTRFALVLAGLAALSACSERRERRVASTDNAGGQPDLTLPDTVSRRDTSITLSSRSEGRVSPVEQQVEPRPAKPSRPARRKTTTPKPGKPPADTVVQGYAPARNTDTTSERDSTPDSEPPAPEPTLTLVDSVPDSVSRPRVDTSRTASDSVSSRPVDSVTVLSPDTLATRAADTTSTPATDTVVASASTAPTPSSTTPPVNVAARTLPIGTAIHAALDDSITSRRDTVGQTISAHVMENVTGADGRTLIAAGTPIRLTVTQIRPSRSKNSQGRLALGVHGIALSGQLVPVKAEVRPVPRELRGRGVTGSEVAKVGGGAAAGAVLGRVVGGNTRGAVIGGVAGAAAGAVVATQTATRDVVVKAKTPVVFVLTAPLVAP
jgi:hypothetical protein